MSIYERDPSTGQLKLISGKPNVLVGATSSTAGQKGQVPAPSAGDQDKYLKGDGNWSQDASSLTANFTSSDPGPTNNGIINNFTSASALTSGDSVARQLDKLSRMVYNVRKTANTAGYLYDRLSLFINGDNVCATYTGNLNNITKNSIYNTNNAANSPENQWGFLITVVHNYGSSYATQIWMSMQNPTTTFYIRTKIGGNWYGWVKLSPFTMTKRSVDLTLTNGYRQYDTGRTDIVCASGCIGTDASIQCTVNVQDSRWLRIWAPNSGSSNTAYVKYWTYD